MQTETSLSLDNISQVQMKGYQKRGGKPVFHMNISSVSACKGNLLYNINNVAWA